MFQVVIYQGVLLFHWFMDSGSILELACYRIVFQGSCVCPYDPVSTREDRKSWHSSGG
uniref:Uncharacterized protein n=1 Tax=Moniliophthora roreri TaxID=221103 RepID=A0A0W0GEI9_MONRR